MMKFINNSRILLVFIIPFLLGTLTVFSFQPFNITLLNFLVFPILFYLVSSVSKRSKNIYRKKPFLKNLFYIGFYFGFGFFISGTHWISNSLTFDDNFRYLIPFSFFLIPLFLGLFYGLGTVLVGPFLKYNFPSILIFSSSFAFIDFLRSKILTGFPWNLWAYSWSWFTEFLQILNLIGIFAFNLITITFFCVPAIFFFKNKKKNYVFAIISLALFFIFYIYGSYTINGNNDLIRTKQIDKSVNIKIVSPNFDLKYDLDRNDVEGLLKKLIRYSEPNKNEEAIFIWPEGVFTG